MNLLNSWSLALAQISIYCMCSSPADRRRDGRWPCPGSCLLTWFKHVCQSAGDSRLTAYLYFKRDLTEIQRKGRRETEARASNVWIGCGSSPAEPKVWQLAGWYLWVTGQTLAGRKGTEDGQDDDWIPRGRLQMSLCFGLNTENTEGENSKWATWANTPVFLNKQNNSNILCFNLY